MTNINIEIPDDLHKQLKIQATMKDHTLKDYLIDILEQKTKNEKRQK